MHFNIKNLLIESEEWNNQDGAVYKKLYYSLKDLILKQSIPNNIQLSPSRILANDLKVSRSTVLKAFDLLCFERYITAKKGSGYYVSYTLDKGYFSNELENKDYQYPAISKRAKLFQKHKYISTDNFSKKNVAFRPGLPPLDIFPVEKWKQISNQYWRKATPTNLSYAPSEGIESLRMSIVNYLRIYRNIECSYDQIIITTGSLHSMYLIANSLIDSGDEVIMENPTFPRAYKLFKSLKAKITPCSIDKNGLQIDTVKSSNPKLLYTTPSNQYPSGIKMTYERRIEVLNWVSKKKALIIEDDYDHEFSNWKKPIKSLFSLDKENRVIYIGTFNKLLHPSLRVGYMIVPKYLKSPIISIYEQSSRFVPTNTQETLDGFIAKNYLNKHIRNVIETSSLRREIFIESTKDILSFDRDFDGLHIIGKLKNHSKDSKIYKELLQNNVVAYPLSNYFLTKEKEHGLVLGYSSVNEKVMREKIKILFKVLG